MSEVEINTSQSGFSADADFPVPGTPEWGVMNRRRGELIHKKNRAGLTPNERVEYERLQRLSLAAIQRAFPAPNGEDTYYRYKVSNE